MYFEFESVQTSSSQLSPPNYYHLNHHFNQNVPLSRRHRLLSSSTQSIGYRSLIDDQENDIIENIVPSQCNLYLLTRKKLSQLSNNMSAGKDLRKEVLLSTLHRSITSSSLSTYKESNSPQSMCHQFNDDMKLPTHELPIQNSNLNNEFTYQKNKFTDDMKNSLMNHHPSTGSTSTSTTTMACNHTSGGSVTSVTVTNTMTMTSTLKHKRSSTASSSPTLLNDGMMHSFDEEWKEFKRMKVVHSMLCQGSDSSQGDPDDIMMLDDNGLIMSLGNSSSACPSTNQQNNDLNDLTNNFHRLKTPFK